MTAILGLSAYYHDSAACLLVDGKIVAAAQEERFTRKKHDAGFPAHAGALVPRRRRASRAEQLDHVAFYDKPLVKFERLFETYLEYAPRGFASFRKAMPLWIADRLWMSDRIGKDLGCGREGPLRRPSRVARGVGVLPVAVRGGGHPHDGRRRRVGHLLDRARAAGTRST